MIDLMKLKHKQNTLKIWAAPLLVNITNERVTTDRDDNDSDIYYYY